MMLTVGADFSVEHPKDMEHGDYATNIALVEAKKRGRNPKEVAGEFADLFEKNKFPEIEKVEVAGAGFINFFLKKEVFAEAIMESIKKAEKFGENKSLFGQRFFIEHTQPNPFKEFHIGHLMNNAIGESIVRLIRANGAAVKTASYHGDVGLHVAKVIWAMFTKQSSLLDAYAVGHAAFEADENAKKEIIEINKKIYENGDGEIQALYEDGRRKSLDYFNSIYKRLDSHFDYHFYESEAGEVGKAIVLKNVGPVFEESQGAIVYKGEKVGLHTRVFLNSDGLPTYEGKEIGLASIKRQNYTYDFSLTVTANEQDAFFSVTEAAIGEVFPELKGKLKHISHGLLKLPTGKMSSRTGTVIAAETLIDDVKKKILEKMADRKMDDKQKEQTVEIVAIGAIKYSILHQAIGGDIVFDFDKSLSFEGDSGPYLQYAYVRAQSVIEKAKEVGVTISEKIPGDWHTTQLEKLIARFGEVVERAGNEYAPHYIATYLIELAGSFNNFYTEHKIADPSDPSSGYKLALTESSGIVMKKGLDLLGIKVPQQM